MVWSGFSFSSAGRTFEIVDFIKDEVEFREPTLVVKNPANGRNMCMFNQSVRLLGDMHIIVTGYYEKMKQNEIGKSYKLRKGHYVERIFDRQRAYVIPGDVLNCVDVAIRGNSAKDLMLVLKDSEGNAYTTDCSKSSLIKIAVP